METTKESIDLGIVVSDANKALEFYRDRLGMEQIGERQLPAGGRMYRLRCGTSVIKLSAFPKPREVKAPPGGPFEAGGIRYFTISVPDLRGLIARLESVGIKPFMPITDIGGGMTVAMVSDPDGNTVEFLQPA
jgi:catechol 2,3-dioxygenase-like lactoylglutathione lyase family enzyme